MAKVIKRISDNHYLISLESFGDKSKDVWTSNKVDATKYEGIESTLKLVSCNIKYGKTDVALEEA